MSENQYIKKLNELASKEYSDLNLGLSRIKKILTEFNNPQNKYPVIHVAGTNGKGSTSCMINSILVESGYSVGLYTSPHFISCQERIRVNNELISEKDLEILLKEIFILKELKKIELTYFEVLTIVAFKYFAEKNVNVVVLEVGLGGRLDATNVVKNTIACVITSIDIDHTEFLGKKLVDIAKEKGGIIKNNADVIVNTGHKQTDSVIKKICKDKSSKALFFGKDFSVTYQGCNWKKREESFSYNGIFNNYVNLSTKCLGEHQARNASLALACMESIVQRGEKRKEWQFNIGKQDVYKGLKSAYWPGRMEILKCKFGGVMRTIILDGAHNEAGSKVLAKSLSSSPYAADGIVFVISVMRDKNYKAMCRNLSQLAKKVIILKLDAQRELEQDVLAREWGKHLPDDKISIAQTFEEIPYLLQNNENIICITGSLYALALVKNKLKN